MSIVCIRHEVYKSVSLVLCPDHTSHEENGLVNQVEYLGPITRMR